MQRVFKKVYEITERIPKGKVATYGQIARWVGTSPRVVGNALHQNPNPRNIPCHRVVNREGKLASGYAFGGARKQRRKLLKEGVKFKNEKCIDLEKHLWQKHP